MESHSDFIARELARAIGHPNNTTYRHDIADAMRGRGPWTVREYLARLVGRDEADEAIRIVADAHGLHIA